MHLHLPQFHHATLLVKGSYREKHELTPIYFFYDFTTEIEGSVKPSVFVVEGTFSRKTEELIDGSLVAIIIALSVVIIFIGLGCFLRIKYKPTKENPESKYMKYFLVKKKRYSECANNTTKSWGSNLTLILKSLKKKLANC